MKGQAHSTEKRAEVIAALLAGQGVNEVARQYKIPKATVSDIKRSMSSHEFEQVRTQKRERLADLIEGHLRQSLSAATALAHKVQTNDEWFSKQNAADIGVLYGILTDKSVRILEAAEASETSDSLSE